MKKNTATNEVKFLVKNIQLDVEDEIKFNNAEIRDILLARIGKETTLAGLNDLQDQITAYCRSHGYPAAAAYLPAQESEDGNVIIKVIPGRYGDVKLDNKSRFKDAAAQGFLAGLKKGEIIRTKDLETALYTISDFSGARAVGTLSAGKSFGTSDVTVHIEDGKPSSTIVYAENYGSESTGRYRYGAQHSIYNVDGMGSKVNVGALISNKSLHNYYVNYEALVGHGVWERTVRRIRSASMAAVQYTIRRMKSSLLPTATIIAASRMIWTLSAAWRIARSIRTISMPA